MWASEKAPPVMVPPEDGIRYKVDIDNRYVEWSESLVFRLFQAFPFSFAPQWTFHSTLLSVVTLA